MSKKFTVTRTVSPSECSWLTKTFTYGAVVYEYHGPTYGCIGSGMAVTQQPNETPFFEFPSDALAALDDEFVEVKQKPVFKIWHIPS